MITGKNVTINGMRHINMFPNPLFAFTLKLNSNPLRNTLNYLSCQFYLWY